MLNVKLESELIELRVNINVSNNIWHVVTVHVGTGLASLQVDGEEKQMSRTSSNPLHLLPKAFVGGFTDFRLLPSEISQTTGLVGCLHDRMANGQSVELNVVQHGGQKVQQCLEPVCPYIQCQNGATCTDQNRAPGFHCQCPPQFTGVFCASMLQLCNPNLCLFGGECREEETSFICLCPLGRAGRSCEEGEINGNIELYLEM